MRGRTVLSGMGRSKLREAFFMPALVALCYNLPLMTMKERLLTAGKHKTEIAYMAST